MTNINLAQNNHNTHTHTEIHKPSKIMTLHVRWHFIEVDSSVFLHDITAIDAQLSVGVDGHHHRTNVGLKSQWNARLKIEQNPNQSHIKSV